MEKELLVLFLLLMWTRINCQGIQCESQPPIREDVLEIQLGNYATIICEHESRVNTSNEIWYLNGRFNELMGRPGGHEDLINTDWENVPCLFSQNSSCSRFFVTIAATSNEFNNFETKACTTLRPSAGSRQIQCNERMVTILIIEDTVSKTPSPTVTLPMLLTSSFATAATSSVPELLSTPHTMTTTDPLGMTSTTNALPVILPTPTTAVTDPPSVTSSSTGWMNQLKDWTDIFSLANIANNVLQTILIIAVLLVLKGNNQREENVNIDGQPNPTLNEPGQAFNNTFEMNGRGDQTDASLSTLLSNNSAIDMTGQTQPNSIVQRQMGRLRAQQNRAVRRQNSQKQEETVQQN